MRRNNFDVLSKTSMYCVAEINMSLLFFQLVSLPPACQKKKSVNAGSVISDSDNVIWLTTDVVNLVYWPGLPLSI